MIFPVLVSIHSPTVVIATFLWQQLTTVLQGTGTIFSEEFHITDYPFPLLESKTCHRRPSCTPTLHCYPR
jgi:hypothetical protein